MNQIITTYLGDAVAHKISYNGITILHLFEGEEFQDERCEAELALRPDGVVSIIGLLVGHGIDSDIDVTIEGSKLLPSISQAVGLREDQISFSKESFHLNGQISAWVYQVGSEVL